MTENTFQHKYFHLSLTKEPNCKVKLVVDINPEGAKRAEKEALKNISKEVSLPGFRKGHAPEPLLKKTYKKDLEKEFRNLLINNTLREAIDLIKIHPFSQDERIGVDLQEVSIEKGGKLHIEYESYPDVPDINPKDIVIEAVIAHSVDEEKIQKHIERLRLQHATHEPVADRGAAIYDIATIDMEMTKEGETETLAKQAEITLLKDSLESWLFETLLGMSINESRTVDRDGKEVKVTVTDLKNSQLPELDQAFAEKFQLSSIEQLRQKVEKLLKNEEERRLIHEKRSRLEEALANTYVFDVPATLLQTERSHRLERLKEHRSAKEMKEFIEKMGSQLDVQIKKDISVQYLLHRFIDKNNIQPTESEILNEMIHQMKSGYHLPDTEEGRIRHHNHIKRVATFNKAFDHLLEMIQVN